MKCPHCNGEHPDNFKFCPITGQELKSHQEIDSQFKACTNNDCPEFGKYVLPLEANFCPTCGKPICGIDKGNHETLHSNESILFVTYQEVEEDDDDNKEDDDDEYEIEEDDNDDDEEDDDEYKYVQIFNETQRTPVFRKVLHAYEAYGNYPSIYKIEGHDYLFFDSYTERYEISVLGIKDHFTDKAELRFVHEESDFLLKGDEFGQYYDIINRHTKRTICSKVLSSANNIESLKEGWYQIMNYLDMDFVDGRYILFKDEKFIQLEIGEYVLSDGWFTNYGNYDDYYISENRIITGIQKAGSSGTLWHDELRLIRIRDYNGRIIRELEPEIIVKSSFHHGKATILLPDRRVGFIGLNGEIEMIPDTTLLCDDIHDSDVSLLFISEENLIINDKDESESEKYAVIKNIRGKVIFDDVYRLEFLTRKYVMYKDNTNFMYGVIDNNGNVILRALYQHIQVLQ